jgi:hypothetical protein
MFEKLKKIFRKSTEEEPTGEGIENYFHPSDPCDPANTRKAKKYPDDGWHQ